MRRLPVLPSRASTFDALPPRPLGFGEGDPLPILDREGRRYTYLRLSLTDRCNYACVYCMPPEGEREHGLRRELLTFEEIERLVGVFVAGGVRRLRLTGGEPTVRKGLLSLVRALHRAYPELELAMTTNGFRLGELAAPLAEAGLGGVNVSIDSLDPARFREITRGGRLEEVTSGIEAALAAGLEVKLNIVALGGFNDGEVGSLVDWSWERGVVPRFIELMPLGEAAKLPEGSLLPEAEIVRLLGERLEPEGGGQQGGQRGGPSRGPALYRLARSGAAAGGEAKGGEAKKVGFITAMSESFCQSCNRVRVTADGAVRACLASRKAISLRDVIRDGGSDADLAWAIHYALSAKAVGHFFLDPQVSEHSHVGMSLIGG